MHDETMDNFNRMQYGNDGRSEKWADRYYYRKKDKGGSAEGILRYRKLDYSGHLRGSAKAVSGRGYAAVRFGANYAKLHNEGVWYETGGDGFRRPPKSSRPIKLGVRPYQRQFAGIGRRTIKNALRIYSSEFRRLT